MEQVVYSADQRALRDSVRRFVQQHVAPVAHHFDSCGETPEVVYRAFFDAGLLHGHIPAQYGGRGHGAVTSAMVAEELAYGCTAIAAGLMVPILPITLLLLGGSARQLSTFVRPLTARFSLPALACTEAEAGSDLRSIRTRATRDADGYVLSGHKSYVTNLPYAEFVVVIARTEPGDGRGSQRALSAFVVPMSTPGIEMGHRWHTSGLRSLAVWSCHLRQVHVGEELLVGKEGEGLALLNAALDLSRTMIASLGAGACRRVLHELLRYAREHELFGARLLGQQDYRFKLVAIEEAIATTRLLVWLAGARHDAGLRFTKEASLAKLHAGRTSREVASEASAMMGGAGFVEDSVVAKFHREASAVGLVEGPEPVQREIVFFEMLRRGPY